ncbi:DUF3597 domain-containing protein [Rhizobium sp. SIMBA_035]
MSIFDRIKHAIFGEAHASQTSAAATPSSPTSSETSTAPLPTPVSTAPVSGGETPTSGAAASEPSQSAPASGPIDVESILNAAVKKSGQKLDWRHSIVDLMKSLGMNANLEERKELARELGYDGDAHDSAKMNIFLHKALMKKLSENGGKVPADLLD